VISRQFQHAQHKSRYRPQYKRAAAYATALICFILSYVPVITGIPSLKIRDMG